MLGWLINAGAVLVIWLAIGVAVGPFVGAFLGFNDRQPRKPD